MNRTHLSRKMLSSSIRDWPIDDRHQSVYAGRDTVEL